MWEERAVLLSEELSKHLPKGFRKANEKRKNLSMVSLRARMGTEEI
jgi:hypothetical protein